MRCVAIVPIVTVLIICFCLRVVAFSPYENRLLTEGVQRIGMIAFVEEKQLKSLQQLADQVVAKERELGDVGIVNLSIFFREVNDQILVFAYFESQSKFIAGWEQRLPNSLIELKKITQKLRPHKRAKPGEVWLRTEWINLIASDRVFPHSSKQKKKMGLISGLKPKYELQYRQLHQSNWPGVVDGMVNSNYRNWTTFLVDIDQSLYLLTFVEYIGKNIEEDNRLMAADPVTQRWWQHTEECLINLHGEGNWSSMTSLTGAAK